jgi:alkylhydroperoxidase family enzyme
MFADRSLMLTLPVLMTLSGSSMAEGPLQRIRPLPEAEWSPEVRELLGCTHERVASMTGEQTGEQPKTLNILLTMAHNPTLMRPFLGFATALAQQGALTRRDSELLALRVIWHCQSDFEWGHHAAFARTAGISEEEIARIVVGPEAEGWSEKDRALLRAADQLHAHQQIDDEVWKVLAAEYDEAQLVEIPFVVGQYTMLSMVANATGVVLEEEFDPLPEAPASSAP